MPNVPYVLSADDSAHTAVLAHAIYTRAERLNRQVVSRYGMDIFQGVEPTFTLKQDYLYILYHFPGVVAYTETFIDDQPRLAAFENSVALRVHLLATHQLLPIVAPLEA